VSRCGILLMLGPAPARADWQFAPLFGYSFKGETSLIDLEDGATKVHWSVGGTATLIGRGPIGVEGLFMVTPHFFESTAVSALTGSRTYAVMGNVVLAVPLRWNEYGLRPFFSGGLGLLHASQEPQIVGLFPINQNFLGYNLGGGAVGFIADRAGQGRRRPLRIGVRFDLRYFSSLSRTDETIAFGALRLRYWTGAVGVVLGY
jgi:hypothetical protein